MAQWLTRLIRYLSVEGSNPNQRLPSFPKFEQNNYPLIAKYCLLCKDGFERDFTIELSTLMTLLKIGLDVKTKTNTKHTIHHILH